MKGDFVVKLLEVINEIGIATGEFIDHLPAYKGFRYRSFQFPRYGARRVKVGFYNLKKRGLIKDVGDRRFAFTKKGGTWYAKSTKRYFIKTHPEWDLKWRVIIFDIPKELHRERIKFRYWLKSLGFFPLQESVFVFPYPCEEELGDICARLKISEYIDVLIAESAGFREEEIKEYYEL